VRPRSTDRAPLALKRIWAAKVVALLAGEVTAARVAEVVRVVEHPRDRQEELDV